MGTSTLMTEGLQLMVLGMSTVFLFLGLLVAAMHTTSRLVRALEARRTPATQQADSVTGAEPVHSDVVAAISAAIHRYRQAHKH